MHRALVILTAVLGFLGSLAAMVAFPAGMLLFSQIDRTLHADTYRPATFTVAWVAYSPSAGRRSAGYWAIGTIDGHRERFGLEGVVSRAEGWDDLEAQVEPGRQIRVLYDPSFPKEGEGRDLRVIAYEDDFGPRQRQRLRRTAVLIYAPSLALMAASIALGVSIRRPPVVTTALTVFFLGAGIALLLLMRGVQTMYGPGGEAMAGHGAGRIVFGALSAVSCPSMVLGFGGLVWYVWRRRKRRAAALHQRAAGMGFQFLGDAADAEQEIEALGAFALFARGASRYVDSRMRGSVDGYDVTVFDYGLTPTSDDASTWRTVAYVTSPTLRLPVFRLEPKTLVQDLGEVIGVIEPLEFEAHERFSQDYVLRGPDPAALRAAFGERALAFFEHSRGWYVESLGDRLIAHRQDDTVPVERLEAFLDDVLRLVRTLDSGPT